MSDGRTGKVLPQESVKDSEDDISSYNRIDFVQLFPLELSLKLFSYLPDQDLLSCCFSSSEWRKTIDDNTLWKLMCTRRGWVNEYGMTDPLKWTRVLSHVADSQTFQFRHSPEFESRFPPDSRSNVNPICEWAMYFHHCSHLENNWQKGICVIEEMEIPEEFPVVHITNDTSCNGKYLAAATDMGYVFLWTIEGVPKLITTVKPEEDTLSTAVEAIQLTSDFLVVLYENKKLQVFIFLPEVTNNSSKQIYERYYKTEIRGFQTENRSEFRLECIDQMMEDSLDATITGETEQRGVNQWIHNFVDWNVNWFNAEDGFPTSDALLLVWENLIIISGMDCRNILAFDMLDKRFVKSISLPRNSKCCCKCFLSSSKLFVSAKKVLTPGSMEHREISAFYVFVFSLTTNSFEESDYTEINAVSQIEEIQPDEKNERVVYVSHQGAVTGFDLVNKDFLFLHQANGIVDNLLVIEDRILYHHFHGRIFSLNWLGEVLYDIDAHIGIVRGIRCVNQFIVSAGDAKELCVWDLKTGKKIYTIYHQPSRIHHLYADETKIITVGKEDPPVLIGFW